MQVWKRKSRNFGKTKVSKSNGTREMDCRVNGIFLEEAQEGILGKH